jgi:chromosomal replication initiation ATPase DnaA
VDLASRPGDPRWQRALNLIQPQVAADEFTTWLSTTWLVEVVDGVATIATPNVFARETLEGRFLPLITAALHTVLGSAVQPQIVIGT